MLASKIRFTISGNVGKPNYIRSISHIFIIVCILSSPLCFGQTNDSSKNVNIDLTAKTVVYFKTDTAEYHKFIGDAVFIQGTDTLYCDSLYQHNTTKNIEAFGDVKIHQLGGTKAQSDYLRYTSGTKLAYMRNNVSLTDGKNNLKCTELTYDLGTKTGVYTNGGTLTTDSTIVTSREGEYKVNTKDARFKKDVVVKDVRYHIVSDDLAYNTDNKLVTFFSPSVVTSDSGKSKLKTSYGTYDSKTGTAHFIGHSSVFNEDHYLEGDSIYYNKLTGYGYADGHVISIDTTRRSTLYCSHLEYFKFKRIMWATGKPVLEQVNGKDTLYMRADTFYSFPSNRSFEELRRLREAMNKEQIPAISVIDSISQKIAYFTISKESIQKIIDSLHNVLVCNEVELFVNKNYTGLFAIIEEPEEILLDTFSYGTPVYEKTKLTIALATNLRHLNFAADMYDIEISDLKEAKAAIIRHTDSIEYEKVIRSKMVILTEQQVLDVLFPESATKLYANETALETHIPLLNFNKPIYAFAFTQQTDSTELRIPEIAWQVSHPTDTIEYDTIMSNLIPAKYVNHKTNETFETLTPMENYGLLIRKTAPEIDTNSIRIPEIVHSNDTLMTDEEEDFEILYTLLPSETELLKHEKAMETHSPLINYWERKKPTVQLEPETDITLVNIPELPKLLLLSNQDSIAQNNFDANNHEGNVLISEKTIKTVFNIADTWTFSTSDTVKSEVDTISFAETRIPELPYQSKQDSISFNPKSDTSKTNKTFVNIAPENIENKNLKQTNDKKKSTKQTEIKTAGIKPIIDTAMADSTAPLIFIGYHHVRIFSDSLQGKCDSICYSQADSTIRMMFNPIAWSHLSQITGDTILLRLDDSGKLKSMFVPNNALVVSQSGPAKAHLFDQVQGKTLTGYFVKNTITKLVVVPNSEAIYYSKDAKGAYIGESEAKSERMKIFFEDQQINKIIFEKDVSQTMTPLEKVNIPDAHLSRFKWLIDQRPKSKKELFD